MEIRDSTNARVDAAFPSQLNRFVFYIDGVPIEASPWWKLQDDYYVAFSGVSRPAGVYVFTRKTSLNQRSEGLLDTAEATLSTNPGTLLEIAANPWGTFSNTPAQINVIVGQIVPRGTLPQGLPEV